MLTFLSLLPSPLFALLSMVSYSQGPSICGSFAYEMPLMWLLMSMAHLVSWAAWWRNRQYQRILSVKQQ